MGPATEKVDLSTTQSDIMVLQEKGFILEKMVGEGSYAKVNKHTDEYYEASGRCKQVFDY